MRGSEPRVHHSTRLTEARSRLLSYRGKQAVTSRNEAIARVGGREYAICRPCCVGGVDRSHDSWHIMMAVCERVHSVREQIPLVVVCAQPALLGLYKRIIFRMMVPKREFIILVEMEFCIKVDLSYFDGVEPM